MVNHWDILDPENLENDVKIHVLEIEEILHDLFFFWMINMDYNLLIFKNDFVSNKVIQGIV